MTLDSVIAQNEDVLYSDVADGMSLMDIESGKYFHFDATGARIWKRLDGTIAVAELCEKLREEFDVDAETCREDTREFLQKLADLDLVTLVR